MNQKTKNYFGLSLFLFILIFSIWIFLSLSAKSKENQALLIESQTAENRQKDSQLFSEARLAEDAQGQSAKIFGFFVSSSNIASLVENIETKGKTLSLVVKFDRIDVPNIVATSPLTSLDMRLSAAGSWGNIVAFVGSLERMPTILSLSHVSFVGDSDPKKGWHADIEASSFVSN